MKNNSETQLPIRPPSDILPPTDKVQNYLIPAEDNTRYSHNNNIRINRNIAKTISKTTKATIPPKSPFATKKKKQTLGKSKFMC